jgi:hypothetical protein
VSLFDIDTDEDTDLDEDTPTDEDEPIILPRVPSRPPELQKKEEKKKEEQKEKPKVPPRPPELQKKEEKKKEEPKEKPTEQKSEEEQEKDQPEEEEKEPEKEIEIEHEKEIPEPTEFKTKIDKPQFMPIEIEPETTTILDTSVKYTQVRPQKIYNMFVEEVAEKKITLPKDIIERQLGKLYRRGKENLSEIMYMRNTLFSAIKPNVKYTYIGNLSTKRQESVVFKDLQHINTYLAKKFKTKLTFLQTRMKKRLAEANKLVNKSTKLDELYSIDAGQQFFKKLNTVKVSDKFKGLIIGSFESYERSFEKKLNEIYKQKGGQHVENWALSKVLATEQINGQSSQRRVNFAISLLESIVKSLKGEIKKIVTEKAEEHLKRLYELTSERMKERK